MWEYPNRPAGDWPMTLRAISAFGFEVSQSENKPIVQYRHVAAGNREGYNYTVSFFQFFDVFPNFNNFTHGFVAEDVAGFHGGHHVVIKMQVRTADGGRGDAHDHVGIGLNLRFGNTIDTDIVLAVPGKGFHHLELLFRCNYSRQ